MGWNPEGLLSGAKMEKRTSPDWKQEPSPERQLLEAKGQKAPFEDNSSAWPVPPESQPFTAMNSMLCLHYSLEPSIRFRIATGWMTECTLKISA